MCPSTSSGSATFLLGVALPSGRVAYGTPAVPVSPALIKALDDDDAPLESRYRFAGMCVESGCGFWSGSGCSLWAELADSFQRAGGQADAADLPKCAIRARCRWYGEQGSRACAACRYVVTDTRNARM